MARVPLHPILRIAAVLAALVAIALPAAAGGYASPTGINLQGTPQHLLMPRWGEARQVPHPSVFVRQVVTIETGHPAGTIIVDSGAHFLYLTLGDGTAIRYGIGVARAGFEWTGTHRITRMAEWPSWTPPSEMLLREPFLPHHVPGGIDNPLGARALYLGSTLYRIHGTNEPWTIGQDVSSGCIRLTNEDIVDLYARVTINTRVVVF